MDIVKSISHKLAKEVLSISVNGVTWDLMRGITTDPRLSCIHGTMKRDAMLSGTHLHTLWQKLCRLFTRNIKFGIGPAIENGFYYDVDPGEGVAIQEKDLVEIEKKNVGIGKKERGVLQDRR